MDLVLVLDCSHSITIDGWQQIKIVAKTVINTIDVTPQGTHVSLIAYSSDVENFYMFDNDTNKETLSKVIDGLSFYGGWSRLDIALNAVLRYVFNPISGSRKNVPKVVVVFSDGNTDGAINSPDDIPNWRRIISKPLTELRNENITILAVACGLKNNNYPELNLIGGDRANVYNMTDINMLIGTLMRTSSWNCPEKPKLCTSTPPSCRTSTTCLSQLSTCFPVIPATKCTPITTTCRETEKQFDGTLTPTTLQPSSVVPSANLSTSTTGTMTDRVQTPSVVADTVEVISVHSTSIQQPVIVHTHTVQPIIGDQASKQPISVQSTIIPSSTVQLPSSVKPTSTAIPSNAQAVAINKDEQKIITVTEIRYVILTAGVNTSSTNAVQSTPSLNNSSTARTTEITQTPSTQFSETILQTINQTISQVDSTTSATLTISTDNTSNSSATPEPFIKDKPANRFSEEKHKSLSEEKHSSWFDSFVPEFVRKWMAIEP